MLDLREEEVEDVVTFGADVVVVPVAAVRREEDVVLVALLLVVVAAEVELVEVLREVDVAVLVAVVTFGAVVVVLPVVRARISTCLSISCAARRSPEPIWTISATVLPSKVLRTIWRNIWLPARSFILPKRCWSGAEAMPSCRKTSPGSWKICFWASGWKTPARWTVRKMCRIPLWCL